MKKDYVSLKRLLERLKIPFLATFLILTFAFSFEALAQTVTGTSVCEGSTLFVGVAPSKTANGTFGLYHYDGVSYTKKDEAYNTNNTVTFSGQTDVGEYQVWSFSGYPPAPDNPIALGSQLSPSLYIYPTPTASLSGDISPCYNETEIYTTDAGGTGYTWTITNGTGTSSSNTISITWDGNTGAGSVSVTYIDANGCTPDNPTVLDVDVKALPSMPTANSLDVCYDGNTHTGFADVGVGEVVVWYTTETGTTTTTAPSLVTAGYTSAWAAAQNTTTMCESDGRVEVTVEVYGLPTPSIVSGEINPCVSTEYTYTSESGKSNYSWSVSANGSITGGGNISDDYVDITWGNTPGSGSVFVNYENGDGCDAGTPFHYDVNIGGLVYNENLDIYYCTLQEAISAANTNDILEVSGELYLTTNILLNKKLTIDGLNVGVIKGDNTLPSVGGGRYFMLITSAGAGSTIQNLDFDKTDKTGVQNIIGLQANNVTFDNCNFSGQFVVGEGDVSRAFEVAYNTTGILIQNCSFIALRQPAYFNPGSQGQVLNNYIEGTKGWVLIGQSTPLTEIVFDGNSWLNNDVDIYLNPDVHFGVPYDPIATLIANNNNANIQDDRSTYKVLNVTQSIAYASIQAAINEANGSNPSAGGDIITVANGEYTEGTITVDRKLTIIGESEAGVIIDASDNGTGYGILIEADNVTMKNFTMHPPIVSGSVGSSSGGGFSIHASYNHTAPVSQYENLHLENITINDANRTPFDIHGYDGVTLINLTANDAAYGNALQFTGCSDGIVTGLTSSGNAWGGVAVYCSKSAYLNMGSDHITIDYAANNIGEFVYVEDEFGLTNTDITISNWTFTINNNYSTTANFTAYISGVVVDAKSIALNLNSKFSNTKSAVYDPSSEFYVGLNMSIQAAIDVATSGNNINIDAGTFTENIDVNKRVSLLGAGSGAGGTLVTQTGASATPDSKVGVVQLTCSGLSAADPILIQNCRVEPVGMAGISVGRFTEATGTSISYVKLDNVFVVGTNTNPSTEQERGLYVDLTSSLFYLDIDDCAFDNLTYGWYTQKQVSADASTVQYVTVDNTTYNHNNHKGIYAEKLSDATFTTCTANNNGMDSSVLPTYFAPWSAGIDVNTKSGTYANIIFDDCTITNNGIGGAKEGAGITVKGRGTGTNPSGGYAGYPAYVNNVQILGCTITGNERGIRIGEPGKGNATPTNVSVENCNIHGNIQQYEGSDGSAYGGLINMTSATVAIDATHNFWGDASGPAAFPYNTCGNGDAIVGNVSYVPWWETSYPSGTSEISTNPAAVVHNQTLNKYYCTIQDAVDNAVAGNTIFVPAGTYEETVTIEKSLTLNGAQAGVDPRTIGARTEGDAMTESIITGEAGTRDLGIYVKGADGVHVTGVVIDGFEIKEADYAGVRIDYATSLTLKNTFISGCITNEGIKTKASCTNLLIQQVISHDNYGDGIELGGYGTNTGHIIEDSWFYNNVDRGVHLASTDGITVQGVKCYGNLGTTGAYHQGGIITYECFNTTLIDVECYNNAGYGVNFYKENYDEDPAPTGSSSSISGASKVYNNQNSSYGAGDGLRIYLSNNVSVTQLESYSNIRQGIRVTSVGYSGEPCENNDITYCYVHDNGASAIKFEGDDVVNCTANSNKLVRAETSTDLIMLNTTIYTVDATCNWWDPAGTAYIGSNINYIPSLSSGTDDEPGIPGFQPVYGSCQQVVFVNDNELTGDVFTTAVGHDGNLGTADAPFLTVQYAVSVVPAGTTIKVDVGTYNEFITIDESLTLLGAFNGISGNNAGRDGNNETIINPPVTAVRIDPASTSTYLIANNAENVVIDGFTLMDEKDVNGQYGANGGIFSGVGSFDVKNNRVVGLPKYGIAVQRSASNVTTLGTIIDVEISNNLIFGTAISDLGGTWAYAISLSGTVADVLSNVIDQSRVGIAVQPYNEILVEIDEDGLVDGNIFNTYTMGVFNHQGGVSGHYAVSGNWIFSNNQFNLAENIPVGIVTRTTYSAVYTRASKFYFDKSITYINNTFDVSNVGTIGYVKENVEGFTYRNDIFHNFNLQHTADDINFIYTNNTFTSDDFDFYFDRSSFEYPTDPPMEIDLAVIEANNTFTDGSIISGYKLVPLSRVNVINVTQDLGYISIQPAINDANTNDVIEVAAGLYIEDLQINESLTLLGPKATTSRNTSSATDWTSSSTATWDHAAAVAAGEAIIRSASADFPTGLTSSAVLHIHEGYDVTVKGFVIEARNRINSTNVHLVYVEGKDAIINSVTIENNIIGPITGDAQDGAKGRMGLAFDSQSGGNNGLSGSVKGNKIFGAEGNGDNVFVIGSHYNPSMSDYSGMVIENNDVYGTNRSGLELCGGIDGLTVENNFVAYSGLIWDGTNYVESAASLAAPSNIKYGIGVNMIRTGTIANTPLISQNYLENVTISGNVIGNNTKLGVYTGPMQRNLEISGNNITDNGWDGIWLDESGTYNANKPYHEAYGFMDDVSVLNNSIHNATGIYAGVKVTGKPVDLSITDNDIAGNAKGIIQYDGDGQTWDYTMPATCNWWGSMDAYVVQSNTSGDVQFIPFSTATSPTNCIGVGPVENLSMGKTFMSIQDAIDDATTLNSHVIQVQQHSYTEPGQVHVTKSLTIQGEGKETTTVYSNFNTSTGGHGNPAAIWMYTDPGTTVHFKDMTLDATGIDTKYGITFQDGGSVSNVGFNEIKHSTSPYLGIGVQVLDGNVNVTGCTFSEIGRIGVHYRNGVIANATISGSYAGNTYNGKGVGDWLDYALDISGGTTISVSNNTITGNLGVAVSDGSTSGAVMVTTFFPYGENEPNNVTVENNTLTGNTAGVVVGYDANDVSVVTVNNNQIFGNDYGVTSTISSVDAKNNWWGHASGPYHAVYNTCGSGNAVSDFVDFMPWWVDEDMTIPSGDLPVVNVTNNPYTYYCSIQDAIDDASEGDEINVAAGSYTEQLHITTESLSIIGAGLGNTTILSPPTLSLYYTTSNDNYPIVFVDGVENILISDLKIDGNDKGNDNYRFQGLAFWNAGGTLQNAHVTNVMDSPFSGSQHGVGIYAFNDTDGPYTINIFGVQVDDYQKGAIALNGAGLTVNIDDVTTIGAGPTTVTAQNGIQLYGSGGIINNVNVSGNIYTGGSWAASGILLIDHELVTITNSTLINNDPSVYAQDGNVNFSGSTITNTVADAGNGFYTRIQDGIVAKGYQGEFSFDEPSPYDAIDYKKGSSKGTLSSTVNNVTFTGLAKTKYAIVASNIVDGDLIDVNVTNSTVTNWGWGLVAYDSGGEVSLDIVDSKIDNNGGGYYAFPTLATIQDATNNWWGDASGPYNNPYNTCGIGNDVMGPIDFDPWWTSTTGGSSPGLPVENTDLGTFYCSIQDAIDDPLTVDGHTIYVSAGTYDEQVVIDGKAITLQGDGDATIIQPTSSTTLTETFTYPAGTLWPGTVMSSIIMVKNVPVGDVTILDLKVDGINVTSVPSGASRLAGILYGEAGGTIDNARVNYIKTTDYISRTYGIDLCATSGNINIEVKNCNILDWARTGIQAMGAGLTANIHDNILVGPGSIGPNNVPNGIFFLTGVGGNATNNTISACHYTDGSWSSVGVGVYDAVQTGILIETNDVSDCDVGVVLSLNSNNVIVQTNNLHGNGNGIQLEQGSHDHSILDNTITGNTGDGISISSDVGIGNVAHSNDISSNLTTGLTNSSTIVFDAENNWWGNITGPYNDPYNLCGLGNAVVGPVDFDPWWTTATGGSSTGLPVTNVTNDPDTYYCSIQDAINDASAGDEIIVTAGIYTEQLHITTENLSIIGAGLDNTTIKSPSTLTLYYTTSGDNYPIVFVDGVDDVLISDLTIDGDDKGNANYRFQGLGFWNAGGTLQNARVTNVMDSPFSGSQHGVGIYAFNDTDGPYTINIYGVQVYDYQKGAIALNGVGLTVDIDDVTTIGAGPTTVTAQNGIQLNGSGGTINDVNVSGNIYTGGDWAASGILLIDHEFVTITNSTLSNNAPSVYAQDGSVNFSSSTITNTVAEAGNGFYTRIQNGIFSKGNQGEFSFDEPSPYDAFDYKGSSSKGALSSTVSDVIFTGLSSGYAISSSNYVAGDLIDVNVSNCTVTNWGWGLVAFGSGGEVSLDIHQSKIYDNGGGFYSSSSLVTTQDAINNWWGNPTGPYNDPYNKCGLGNVVMGSIDFDPWWTTETGGSSPGLPVVNVTNSPNTYYCNIQDAIADASAGDEINVNDGTYNENLIIDKSIYLFSVNGNASTTISASGGSAISVQADNVEIRGFTITNPTGAYAISMDGLDNLIVRNNNISGIGNSLLSGNTHAIAISSNSDEIIGLTIEDNTFGDIHGGENSTLTGNAAKSNNGSGTAIGVGWSNANYNITSLTIKRNVITNIDACTNDWSEGGKGAYGIIINTGGAGTGQAINAQVIDNEISGLEGLWSHGIGLEGDTPGAIVTNNKIDDLVDYKPELDAAAIMIEDNDNAGTLSITNNSFSNGTTVSVDAAVRNVTGIQVDVTCNWFGTTDPVAIVGLVEGNVNVVSFLTDGTDLSTDIGFQPVAGSCGGLLPVKNVTNNPDTYYATIQNAIDEITTINGDVIEVAAGNYLENVTIDKELTFQGANIGTPGYNARATESRIDGYIKVMADNVTFNGFELFRGGQVPAGEKAAVHIAGGHSGFSFLNNLILKTDGSAPDAGDSFRGIINEFGGISTINIQYNKFEGWHTGVYLQHASYASVTNNVFFENLVGMSNDFPEGVSITDNEFTNNGLEGVGIGGTFSASDIVINDNKITGNPTGVANYGTTVVDVEYNWWGSVTGPTTTLNTCGTGDPVSGPVDFSPWYYESGMNSFNGLASITLSETPDIDAVVDVPVILTTVVTYNEDVSGYNDAVLEDAYITSDIGFPASAVVLDINYNGTPLLVAPVGIGGATSLYLSDLLGSSAYPLNLESVPVTWVITFAGFDVVEDYNITFNSVTYLDQGLCNNVLATDAFKLSFDEATFVIAEDVVDVCGPVYQAGFEADMTYPTISNMNMDILTNSLITSDIDLPTGSVIDWDYNGVASGSYTLATATNLIYLSTIVGTPAASLQGHSGTDIWQIDVTVDAQASYEITIQPVAQLVGIDYPYGGSDFVNINYYTNPTANAGSDGEVCLDESFILNAVPSIGIGTWTQESGTGTATFVDISSAVTAVSVDVADTYTFRWTEVNGTCTEYDDVLVIYNPLPDPVIESEFFSVCAGTTGATYSTPYVTGNAYLWNVAGGSIVLGQSTNQITVNWDEIDPGTITVTEYAATTFCSHTVSETVEIIALPTPVVTGLASVLINSLETYSTTNYTGHAYIWNVTGGAITGGQNTSSITVAWPGTPGNGTISVTEMNLITNCVGESDPFNVMITTGGVDVSGYFTYHNVANTQLSGLSLDLMLSGSSVASTTTDANGYYEFNNVLDGTYTIDVTTSMSAGGINPLDAGLVNLWSTGPSSIERVKWNAGNVVDNNYINSTDAGRIQNHFVYNTAFDFDDWTFWKQPDVSAANPPSSTNDIVVSGIDVTQGYYGLCLGDFNGDFPNPGSKATIASDLLLTYDGTMMIGSDELFELPVKVTSSMQAAALSLILDIPSNLVSVEDIYINNGNVPVNVGVLDYNVIGNELRIGWNSLEVIDYADGDILLTLKLRTTEEFIGGEIINIALNPDPNNVIGDNQYNAIENVVLSTYSIEYYSTGMGELELSEGISLYCYPNPFTDYTTINYTIPVDGEVKLEVYNSIGSLVKILVDETMERGEYSVKFHALDNNNAGVYTAIIRFSTNGHIVSKTHKLVIGSN